MYRRFNNRDQDRNYPIRHLIKCNFLLYNDCIVVSHLLMHNNSHITVYDNSMHSYVNM